MKDGVRIFGGFAGTETGLNERNLAAGHTSILQGNGNSVIRNINNGLTSAALLNGFTITGGHPNNSGVTHGINGGGFYNSNVSPTIMNCIIANNTTASGGGGGGMWNVNSSLTLIGCILTGNSVNNDAGGAIFNDNSPNAKIINCTIAGNNAGTGAGIFNGGTSYPVITNTIIWGNTTSSGNDQGIVGWGNVTYSLIQETIEDTYYHMLDGYAPHSNLFVDAPAGNYRLATGSAAIGTGLNSALTAGYTLDINGAMRIQTGAVDLGAYEYFNTLPVTLTQFNGSLQNSMASLYWNTSLEEQFGKFELQKSINGKEFTSIATITPTGNNSRYSYRVLQPETYAFYRLTMIDLDGTTKHCAVVTLRQGM